MDAAEDENEFFIFKRNLLLDIQNNDSKALKTDK